MSMPLVAQRRTLPVGQVICTQPGAFSFLGTKATTSITQGNGTTRAAAIWVPEPVIIDRIGCEVTIAGEAGSKIRLGIWADGGQSCIPATLILDAGTINGDSATVQEITISQALAPGVYWLSSTVQSAPTTQPTVRTCAAGFEPVGGLYSSSAVPSATGCATVRTDAGALASTWGGYSGGGGSLARIFVRTA